VEVAIRIHADVVGFLLGVEKILSLLLDDFPVLFKLRKVQSWIHNAINEIESLFHETSPQYE